MRVQISSRLRRLTEHGQLRRAGVLLCAGLSVLSAFVWMYVRTRDPLVYDHDVAWMLHAAERLLNGGSIPEDLFDPNPPLIFWCMIPVVWFARMLSVNGLLVMEIVTMALVLGSAVATFSVLRQMRGWTAEQAVAGASVAFFLLFTVGGAGGFGQRDLLIVVLALPYVLLTAQLSAGGRAGSWTRLSAAACAALGIALRPHFVLLWVACEAYRLLATRGRRTPRWYLESLVVMGAGALYIASVLVFAPGWLAKLRMTASTYGAYESPFNWWTDAFWWTAANVGLALVFRFPAPVMHLVRVIALAATVSFAVAAIQSKNWFYHQVPATVFSQLGVAIAALGFASMPNLVRMARLAPLMLVLLVSARSAVLVERTERATARRAPTTRRKLMDIFEEHARGSAVFVMSTSVPPTYPAVNQAGATSASRFSCLWLAPGLYQGVVSTRGRFPYRPPSEWGPTERYFVDAVQEDLRKHEVQVLVEHVSSRQQAFGRTTFRFRQYFSQVPELREFFSQFRFLTRVGGAYDVWVRKE